MEGGRRSVIGLVSVILGSLWAHDALASWWGRNVNLESVALRLNEHPLGCLQYSGFLYCLCNC